MAPFFSPSPTPSKPLLSPHRGPIYSHKPVLSPHQTPLNASSSAPSNQPSNFRMGQFVIDLSGLVVKLLEANQLEVCLCKSSLNNCSRGFRVVSLRAVCRQGLYVGLTLWDSMDFRRKPIISTQRSEQRFAADDQDPSGIATQNSKRAQNLGRKP